MIFDESQMKENNDIWIDLYSLNKFFAKHTQAVVKVEVTKEWVRINWIVDPAVEGYKAKSEKQGKLTENFTIRY